MPFNRSLVSCSLNSAVSPKTDQIGLVFGTRGLASDAAYYAVVPLRLNPAWKRDFAVFLVMVCKALFCIEQKTIFGDGSGWTSVLAQVAIYAMLHHFRFMPLVAFTGYIRVNSG